MNKTFIFTCGDINGIGPEIVIKSLNRIAGKKGKRFIFICPGNVFREISSVIKPAFSFTSVNRIDALANSKVLLFDTGTFRINTGKPTIPSGKAAYLSLEIAAELLKRKLADALITAPLSKEALNGAGYNYPGHTELLAEWFETRRFVMMFLSKKIKAALATIHKPISEVASLLTGELLRDITDVVIQSLKNDFNIASPSIGVLGLNPHAGESGLIGNEEKEVIGPFLKKYKGRKYLKGPFSPDAYWGNRVYEKFDLTLGMYHDQVLIPFKLLNFSKGVNFTAGLPVVRTSPDHGTGFDIAGKNRANENSILEAFYFADIILKNRYNGK
jgi:4-hydroxythreonine-4-phosphate dehydrogenase